MALSIVKIENLPLGWRILRYGCNGQDVVELQQLLCQAGFYFGEQDGIYGILTGEAVTLLQRTYHLKADGIVGRQVLSVLNKKAIKKGRIIYRVKKHEELDKISEEFGVRKSAWRRIPGQADPHKKIYPGLKILLHEKALFIWDSINSNPTFATTGRIIVAYQLEASGELLSLAHQENDAENIYHIISSSREIWVEVLSSPKIWIRLAQELKKIKTVKFGFDLREAPMDKIMRWGDLLQFLCQNLKLPELEFQVLPLLPIKRKLENQAYWVNLPAVSVWTKYIMIEPRYNIENPLLFEASVTEIFKNIANIMKLGLGEKSLLITDVTGMDWNMDQNQYEKLSYKVAKLIGGQYSRNTQYLVQAKLSRVYYLKRNEHHCLIYRDERCWQEFLHRVIELNLAGIVIINFRDLCKAGPEIIAGSFKVIQGESN
jgi:hypothetical protein